MYAMHILYSKKKLLKLVKLILHLIISTEFQWEESKILN